MARLFFQYLAIYNKGKLRKICQIRLKKLSITKSIKIAKLG